MVARRMMCSSGIWIMLFLAAGCVAQRQSEDASAAVGPPPLPPRTGPASVCGTLTITAPVMRVAGRPVKSAAEVQYGRFDYLGDLGVFPVGSKRPDRSVCPARTGYTSTNLRTGIRTLEYDFGDIPVGGYELRVFNISNPDGGLDVYTERFRGEAFSLLAGQPIRCDCGWDLTGQSESGTLRGKILISGNPDSGGLCSIRLEPADWESSVYRYHPDSYMGGGVFTLVWNVPTQSASYGRLFYEISGLNPERYSASNERAFVDLSPTSTDGEVDFRERTRISPCWFGAYHDRPGAHGTIVVNLTLEYTEPWTGDLVLEAVRDGELVSVLHRAVGQIDPAHWRAGKSGSVRGYWLHNLEAGPYVIRVLELGETNLDVPTVVAQLPEPAVLEVPEPIRNEHLGYVWYDYPSPELEVELSVDLATIRD